MTDEIVGAAIGELLTGFSARIYEETRQSDEYLALAALPRTEALKTVWDDTQNITLAVAMRMTVNEGVPLRRNALELLFGIRTEVDLFRDQFRGDMLGGSTDRAFQSYRKLLDAALQDERSPVVEISEDMAHHASLAHVYDHMDGKTSQLLRWLEIRPKSHSVLWQLAGDSWGVDTSRRLRYRLWKEFGRTVFNNAATQLRPTRDEMAEISVSIFGPDA